MKEKLKKIFSKFLTSKKAFFAFLFFIFLGTIFPLRFASAGLFQGLINAVLFIPYIIGTFFLLMLAEISSLILIAASGLLQWVISPSFTNLSYTNPSNPIISMGLSVTQGFVNIVLVLILVFIALAVILRLKDYEAKKLLPIFIIVALLVNFAPVFCGIIVDSANIIMYFFLNEISGFSEISNRMTLDTQGIGGAIDLSVFKPENRWNTLATLVIMTGFNIILTFFLILFALLFIARYISIWILVILSPLAFAAYVLPGKRGTREYFWKWFDHLINWAFIGVTCAFFLYLAEHFSIIQNNVLGGAKGFASQFLPYFVTLAFMFLAAVYGYGTKKALCQSIMSYSRGATGWVAKKAWKGAAIGETKMLPAWRPETAKFWRSGFWKFGATTPREAVGWTAKQWEKVPVLRSFVPEPLRKYSEFRNAIEAEKKNITEPSDIAMDRVANGTYRGKKASAAVDEIVRGRGDSQDVIKAYIKKYKKYGVVTSEDLFARNDFIMDNTLNSALKGIENAGNLGKVKRTDPRLAKIGKINPAEQRIEMMKAIIDAKPGDAANWEREVAEDEGVMELCLALKGKAFLRTLGALKGDVAARQNTINKRYTRWKNGVATGAITTMYAPTWGGYLNYLKDTINIDLSSLPADDPYKMEIAKTGYEKALSDTQFQADGWDEGQDLGPTYTGYPT